MFCIAIVSITVPLRLNVTFPDTSSFANITLIVAFSPAFISGALIINVGVAFATLNDSVLLEVVLKFTSPLYLAVIV